jgi:hypothetical protein
MRSRYRWALLAAAFVVGVTVGQEKDKEKDAKGAPGARPNAYPVEVRFADDSTVKAALQDKTITVTTRYGKLTVPVDEVRNIELGLRIPEDTAKRIDAAVARLGSADYAEREAAGAELLELRELAYPALQKAARSDDAEVSRRAKDIIKTLADTVPPEKLHLPQHDTVVALDFSIVGRVETPTLKARTPYFGETTLKLADVRAMHWSGSERETKLSVDAGKYGAQQETWLDTGLKVRAGAGLLVAAAGTVDLRPTAGEAGTNLVGPDGRFPRAGRGFPGGGAGGGFPGGGGPGGGGRGGRGGGVPVGPVVTGTSSPGALLGRIGEYGKVFVIGSHYEGTAGEEGNLYLRIVPNATNSESSGSYEVRVTTGR